MDAVAPRFNKNQLMTVMLAATVPVNLVDEHRIVFASIRGKVGNHPRYFVVFQEGDDEEKTRFFITNSGAKSYYLYLIGETPAPANPDVWGSKSLEELKYVLTGEGNSMKKNDLKEIVMASVPDTIEDEMPPMSQAFYDKVHAEGGRVTHAGIVYDQPKDKRDA